MDLPRLVQKDDFHESSGGKEKHLKDVQRE
jgi:hypothetical protein